MPNPIREMEPDSICSKLTEKGEELGLDAISKYSEIILGQIKLGQLRVVDLVKKLNPVLTSEDNAIRLRGVQVLCQVIISLPTGSLSAKEIEVLQEFLNLRLIDHKSMEQPVLKCLSYFVDCPNKPDKFNKNLLEFLKTKINVHQMDNKSRLLVYEISRKIVIEKRAKSKTIDSDLLYSIIHMIEGENNPQNLMVCFNLVSYVLKSFDELEPFIDDVFEWLSSYYPIDYTPKESEGGAIKRVDLVKALEECFFANPLNSDDLLTLLLEKLESSPTNFKIESLNYLIKCYEKFPLKSVKDYASSMWTSIRMNCLKKLDLLNVDLSNASYNALSALSTKLSEDRELYLRFVTDLYEELAIAFRKPEMDLFEPAIRLIVSAASAKPEGFDYILDKVLPISVNAIKANELRPIPGLVYLFEKMFAYHHNLNLKLDITKSLDVLATCLIVQVDKNADCLRLIDSLVKGRVKLGQDTLDNLNKKLLASIDDSPLDIEGSLALISINYNPPETIQSLLEFINYYQKDYGELQRVELSVYLRRVVLTLDTARGEELDNLSSELGKFLRTTRELAPSLRARTQTIANVGRLHAIALNKLTNESTTSLLMDLFQTKFCQDLIPSSLEGAKDSAQVYIPVIKWVLKSLVLRNHQLVMPVVNLLFNYVSSDKVDASSALSTSHVFTFIFAEDQAHLYRRENHYQIFALYKQKFYTQASKEMKVRIGLERDEIKRHVMVCLLALQIPHLPAGVYKRDSDWMIRELLKIMQSSKGQSGDAEDAIREEIVSVIYDCVSSFIRDYASENLLGHLGTVIELSLSYACEAKSLQIRRKALSCLKEIASSFDEKELLPMRCLVVDKLRACLADKKRLVRQEAAAARLGWFLVGQPVGS